MSEKNIGNSGCLVIMFYLLGLIAVVVISCIKLLFGIIAFVFYIVVGKLFSHWVENNYNKQS